MKYETIKGTDLRVSKICLGTMTWGEQNTEAEAHAQLDYSLEKGVNFVDTAELYPVPPRKETYGRTEEFIGTWLKKTGKRDQIVLASKVCGPGREVGYMREDGCRLNEKSILEAVDNSLKRLQTDRIDLYQTHWPERQVAIFGRLGYQTAAEPEDATVEITLGAMEKLVRAGKVRHVGVSNETAWGVMKHLNLAKEKSLPRIVSIQNIYNLLSRTFEFSLAEVAEKENVKLLAYSPLAFGILTGKYLNGQRPAGARITLFKRFKRHDTPATNEAVAKYKTLAERHDLDLSQMALAYVNQRPFVLSNIIGATNLDQLRANIDSINLELSEEVEAGIEAIHFARHNPSP